MYIAAFDVGTTAVKGVLIRGDSLCAVEMSVILETLFDGENKEQRPLDWYDAFCKISKVFFSGAIYPAQVSAIIMSGQMQDLIPVDERLMPVRPAILYSDGRAAAQAQRISALVGTETLERVIGNRFDGSMPFAKLLWLKENEPDAYTRTKKVLISSKDYIITRLTGEFATDVTSAATSGLMDIKEKYWRGDWLEAAGLDREKLPSLLYAQDQAGAVTARAAAESGYVAGTPVYAGTGDAGATTLASGICAAGEFNVNLGTSGWVACVSDSVLPGDGVFNLAAMPKGVYINVVPFLNAGSVHKWISKTLAPDDAQADKYNLVDRLLEQSKAGSHGVMFLPYLSGERFPVMDTQIKGGFAGLTPAASKSDLARSALEGVAFSIRQGIERIGRAPSKISLIGGGAQTPVWCQILADVLGHAVDVCRDSEYLPSVAIAAAVLVSRGEIADYGVFTRTLQQSEDCVRYSPIEDNVRLYNELYPRYLKMYPAFKLLSE